MAQGMVPTYPYSSKPRTPVPASGPIKIAAETTVFWKCCALEDVKRVHQMIKSGEADVHMRDTAFGWTPLHWAAHSRADRFLKIILDAKAKADAADNEKNTSLMVASRNNCSNNVKYLLAAKVEMDVQNYNGWTALMWAAICGHEEVCNVLLQAGVDYKKADCNGVTACMWAARHGCLGIVEVLLACGLNIDQTDKAGMTVMDHAQEHMEMRTVIAAVSEINSTLLSAARGNDYEGVRVAIEAGADVNIRDCEGYTPLMYAALHEDLDMVQVVVRHGASPNLLDSNGEEVVELTKKHLAVGDALYCILGSNDRLLEAAKCGDWLGVDEELLIGAYVNVRDEDKRTVLMHAAKQGNAVACGNLVTKGAAADSYDIFGWMASHFSVSSKSLETVSMLHYQGADFAAKTFQGDTCLHIATAADDGPMIQLLIAGQANLEDLNVDGLSSLQFAARDGHAVAVLTLLAYAADPQIACAAKGYTPFHFAVMNGRQEVVELMLRELTPPPRIPLPGDEDFQSETSSALGKKMQRKTKTRPSEITPSSLSLPRIDSVEGSTTTSPTASAGMSSPTRRVSVSSRDGRAMAKSLFQGGGKVHAPATITPSGAAVQAAKGVASKKLNAPKKEILRVGTSPHHALEVAAKKRAVVCKVLKNPLGKSALKQKNTEGKSPLALGVAARVEMALIRLLIEEKADVQAADDKQNTILMEAVVAKMKDVVAILLDMGVNVERQNSNQKTATDLCKDPAIMVLLQKHLITGHMSRKNASGGSGAAMERQETSKSPLAGQTAKGAELRKGSNGPQKLWRVRLEELPTRMTGDMLEEQVRSLVKKCGAPKPHAVRVACNPITAKPCGYAYIDFTDKNATELAARVDGRKIHGQPIRAVMERTRSGPAGG